MTRDEIMTAVETTAAEAMKRQMDTAIARWDQAYRDKARAAKMIKRWIRLYDEADERFKEANAEWDRVSEMRRATVEFEYQRRQRAKRERGG